MFFQVLTTLVTMAMLLSIMFKLDEISEHLELNYDDDDDDQDDDIDTDDGVPPGAEPLNPDGTKKES